jgi:asparagine synthase (glutamine-hydrolysing)
LFADSESKLLQACRAGAEAVAKVLPRLDGCFGIIVDAPEFALAAADPIASIPVFVSASGRGPTLIGGIAQHVCDAAGLTEVDWDAALAIGMAGYALGDHALLKGMRHLRAGEVWRSGARPEFSFYSRYMPRRVVERPAAVMADELAAVLHNVFAKMVDSLDGRPLLVPLSAGYDSRLVAAALKELRYPDVRCYSYGLPGNHEAAAAREIARRLGFRWTFVPITPEIQKAHFTSADYAGFVRFADTLTAIPFNQDFVATRTLLANGYAPKEAVFVNGQTGDFISGNHVPRELWSAPASVDAESRWTRVFSAVRYKHFSLWDNLQTPANLARMAQMFRADLEQDGLPDDPALDWSLFEQSEFMHRQSRYVVSGQRVYEYLAADWRLPLWDGALVRFFESAPLAAKQEQTLYRATLKKLNWGGVFSDDMPVNHLNVRPRWLIPIRWAAKAATAPFGADAWHRFEKRYLAWHMDPIVNYPVVSWSRVARDRRGFRNAISWHAEAYLARKYLALEQLSAPIQ